MADVQEVLARIWSDLAARPAGPLHFRFLIQPVMAAILAARDGINDARTGGSPYSWAILSDSERRRSLLQQGIAATAKISVVALILDAVYQLTTLRTFYPVEALIVVVVLALFPYLIVRGPAGRLARRWLKPRKRA